MVGIRGGCQVYCSLIVISAVCVCHIYAALPEYCELFGSASGTCGRSLSLDCSVLHLSLLYRSACVTYQMCPHFYYGTFCDWSHDNLTGQSDQYSVILLWNCCEFCRLCSKIPTTGSTWRKGAPQLHHWCCWILWFSVLWMYFWMLDRVFAVNKCPGPSAIHNQMLRHMSSSTLYLLNMCRQFWIWVPSFLNGERQFILVPVLEACEDNLLSASCCVMCLTDCLLIPYKVGELQAILHCIRSEPAVNKCRCWPILWDFMP